MKYFKYWVEEKQLITIDGRPEEIKLLIGSQVSKGEAKREALSKAKEIEERIARRGRKEEYEVGIREYVADIIDESNVVSVCRYGAKILNTDEYTVLDLDDYRKSFWDIFKRRDKLTKKERIVRKFEENIKRFPELGADFRIYETAKGIRVIGKSYVDPAARQNIGMMRKMGVDWLYIILSGKQQCYRARLSPKPYRLGIKTMKIRSPLVCETEEYKAWAQMYEKASEDYAVVRIIKSIGVDFSRDPVISYHDEHCNAEMNLKLA